MRSPFNSALGLMSRTLIALGVCLIVAVISALTSEPVLHSENSFLRRFLMGFAGAAGTLLLIIIIDAMSASLWLIGMVQWVGAYLPLTADAYMKRPRTW